MSNVAESIRDIRRCINCEFADPVGDWRTVKTVDCHHPKSPRFTPERDFCCWFFVLSSTFAERGAAPPKLEAARTSLAAKEARVERIKFLVDFYFSPWGAAKAAIWEDIDGDGPAFSPTRVLELVRQALEDDTV